MKKILSLLLAITSTTQLHGMDSTSLCELRRSGKDMRTLGDFDELPEDIHQVIVKTLATSNNLEQTIEAINIATVLRGVKYDNLECFTKLVHVLADKFNDGTGEIAKKIKTPISDHYFDLYVQLRTAVFCSSPNIELIQKLINQGADVNGSANITRVTPLMNAIPWQNINLITLLLNSHANPNAIAMGKTVTDCANMIPNNKMRKQIKQLLEDAQKKLHSSDKQIQVS